MGLFNIFRKNHIIKNEDKNADGSDILFCKSELYDIISKHIGVARLKQKSFAKTVLFNNWNININKGLIYLDNKAFKIQLMGTESISSNSWLWAFANPGNYSKEVLDASISTYNYLNKEVSKEEISEEIMLSKNINGHTLCSIATSLNENTCYYCCRYNENTSLYVLIENIDLDLEDIISFVEIMTIFTELIDMYDLNHRLLVENTLKIVCDKLESDSSEVKGILRNGEKILVVFDDSGRINTITNE